MDVKISYFCYTVDENPTFTLLIVSNLVLTATDTMSWLVSGPVPTGPADPEGMPLSDR